MPQTFESHFNTKLHDLSTSANLLPQLQFVVLTCSQLLLIHMDHSDSTGRAEHPHQTSWHMGSLLFFGFFLCIPNIERTTFLSPPFVLIYILVLIYFWNYFKCLVGGFYPVLGLSVHMYIFVYYYNVLTSICFFQHWYICLLTQVLVECSSD